MYSDIFRDFFFVSCFFVCDAKSEKINDHNDNIGFFFIFRLNFFFEKYKCRIMRDILYGFCTLKLLKKCFKESRRLGNNLLRVLINRLFGGVVRFFSHFISLFCIFFYILNGISIHWIKYSQPNCTKHVSVTRWNLLWRSKVFFSCVFHFVSILRSKRRKKTTAVATTTPITTIIIKIIIQLSIISSFCILTLLSLETNTQKTHAYGTEKKHAA